MMRAYSIGADQLREHPSRSAEPQVAPAMSGSVAVAAHQLSVKRGGSLLLDRVSLEVRAGEVLALLGPNGAGKSTLLSVLAGDIRPDKGRVEFQGRAINAWTLAQLSRRRSVMLQDHQLSFPFTVHQVVEMGRAPWRRTAREAEDNEAIAEALHAADVAHLGARRVPSLSGGERARVHFARVLAGRTGVLMLDEPTAALDIRHQEALLELIREQASKGNAVLAVLHDLNLAAAYADRIALLREGRIVACDTPAQVLTVETVSTVYQTPVEVMTHPRTGVSIVMPKRDG